MLNPPKKINIFGYQYPLLLREEETYDGALGYVDRDKQEIHIVTKGTRQSLADTVMHEVIHAVSDAMNLELDEKKVIQLTTLVRSFVVANTSLLRWVLSLLGEKT